MSQNSTAGLLRSLALIGGSSAFGVVMALLRAKFIAVWIGPVGTGLLGVFNNLYQAGLQMSLMGVDMASIRRIAENAEDPEAVSRIRKAMFAAVALQCALVSGGLIVFNDAIARLMLDSAEHAGDIALVSVALLCGILYAALNLPLQGLRKIGGMARANVLSALIVTPVGLLCVWLYREQGLIAFIILQPLTALSVTYAVARRLGLPPLVPATPGALIREWRGMASLGAAFLAQQLLASVALLSVRAILVRGEGLEAAGHFQAGWTIATQYVGFILQAMAADYYPQLTGLIRDREAATRLVNEQLQLALAVSGPILLGLIGLAPWVIEALYAAAFAPTAPLLQWMSLGNGLKIACWSISFLVVAHGRAGLLAGKEALLQAGFLAGAWALLPVLGLEGVGVAFALAYGGLFFVEIWAARRVHGFRFETAPLALLATHIGLALATLMLSRIDLFLGAGFAVVAGALSGAVGLRLVARRIAPDGRVGRLLRAAFARIGWPLPDPSR